MEIEKTPPTKEVPNQIIQIQNELVNDYDIDSFLQKRAEFITKVKAIMVEGKDYHVIQGKKSLAKGGAEKIASIFGWQATFKKDVESLSMLVDQILAGTLAYICTLTKNDKFVGEGRGARNSLLDKSDLNKSIKMAQKSAFIDAVLRASGLSDFFTQDLEDIPETHQTNSWGDAYAPKGSPAMTGHQTQNSAPSETIAPKSVSEANKDKPATKPQKDTIKRLMAQKGFSTLSEAGINKIDEPTMLDASMIIKKLISMPKKEEMTIEIEGPYNFPEGD